MALSLFHAMQAPHSRTTSSVFVSFHVRRQDVESSRLNLRRSFHHNPWQWGPAPSLSAVTFFVNINSGATICHGMPHKPSHFVDSHASLRVCFVQFFASHNSILGNTQNCSCSTMMTNKDSLSHVAWKRADTVFSNFTKPNLLSKLRHLLCPSSTSSL